MPITESEVRVAFQQALAAQLLTAIPAEHQHMLLQKAVVKVLDGLDLERVVSSTIGDRARDLAFELCNSEDWTNRIKASLQAGFERYLASLEVATVQAFQEMLHGKEGSSYSRVAAVLGCWPKRDK